MPGGNWATSNSQGQVAQSVALEQGTTEAARALPWPRELWSSVLISGCRGDRLY